MDILSTEIFVSTKHYYSRILNMENFDFFL